MEFAFGRGNDGHHVASLIANPILGSENHRLAALSKTLLEIEVAWGDEPLRHFATRVSASPDVRTLGVSRPVQSSSTRMVFWAATIFHRPSSLAIT